MNATRKTSNPRSVGRGAALALLLAASLLSVPLALPFGPWSAPVGEVFRALWPFADVPEAWRTVVVDIRLARVLLAWGCGACLGLAGAVYQDVLRNPLADPFTLGVSSGAAFGASLCIALGLGSGLGGWLGGALGPVPLFALCGGLGALALALALGRLAGGATREGLVLAGIVVSTLLSALISLVKALNEESVSGVVFWIMGSFQGRGFEHMRLLLPWGLVGLALVLPRWRELDVLRLGATQAAHLGVDVRRSRLLLLAGASLMAAASVSVAGVIGFVGLVVPHCARRVLGAEARTVLPVSALGGGLLLVWADVAARALLRGGAELPVGVVTALFGGPFFLFLLARGRGGRSGAEGGR